MKRPETQTGAGVLLRGGVLRLRAGRAGWAAQGPWMPARLTGDRQSEAGAAQEAPAWLQCARKAGYWWEARQHLWAHGQLGLCLPVGLCSPGRA